MLRIASRYLAFVSRSALTGLTGLTGLTVLAGLPACSAGDAAVESASARSSLLAERSPSFDEGAAFRESSVRCDGKRGRGLLGTHRRSLRVGGVDRQFIVHVPVGYDPDRPTPLVVSFHGLHLDALKHELMTGLSVASNRAGFLVVYPEGLDESWNAGGCCGPSAEKKVDDVAFTAALLDAVEDEYCVDEGRVYASGFSTGGFFSYRLACEMADRFAAVASVSGALALGGAPCRPSRPVPVLDIHGTADKIVPYAGGPSSIGGFVMPSVAFSTGALLAADGCEPAQARTPLYARGDASCVTSGACASGSEVVACRIDGGGHVWPGGIWVPPTVAGHVSYDLDATATIVQFFAAHPMTR